MIVEKLSESELALLEILEHPLWNPMFIRNTVDESWDHADYQEDVLSDTNSYISFRAGRAVGKSETLLDKVVYFLINDFFDTHTIAIVTPNRVHLEPLWRKLTRWLAFHPLLKHYKDSINSQVFNITTKNGVTVDCRIAGISGTGASVIGLHTPVLFVDEAGFFPWDVWVELIPTVNTWEKGFQVIVCGTPSGERENNVLYFADKISSQYTHHRVSAHDNPRYSKDDEIRNIQQYSGEDSDDYQRLVLGRHASPVTMVFAKDSIPLKSIPMYTYGLNREDIKTDPMKINRMIKNIPKADTTALGIDLGYTDPTIISIFKKVRNHWVNYARIELEHIEYPDQIKIINRLDEEHGYSFVAIDEGHAGVAVTQELVSKFPHKFYEDRLISVNFSTSHVVGVDLDGNEIKSRVKSISAEKLRRLFDNSKLYLSEKDRDLLSELERVESYKGRSGKTLYRVRTISGGLKGEDHRFASLLCFAYAMYLQEDTSEEKEKPVQLFTSRWANL
jgi:hypothetical protein